MIKPKRRTKEMILCADCKKPIHIDDLALISKEGMFHKECCFKIFCQNPEGFLIGAEMRIRKELQDETQ